MSAIPRRADIAVIGAGVAGLCTALFLARAGRTVAVLERGEAWGESSGANAGTLSLQVKRNEVLQVSRRAIELWRDFQERDGMEIGFARIGGLRVATSERELVNLRKSQGEQAALGVATEWYDGNRLRDFAPWLGPEVQAATYCDWDSMSVPLTAGHGLVMAVRAAGVTVATGAAVTAIARDGEGFCLQVGSEIVGAAQIVIAAGAWTGDVAQMLGVRLPVAADINMLTISEPAPRLFDRVVTHIGAILSLKQYPNGSVLIGGGWQGTGDLAQGTRRTDYLNLVHNLRVAMQVVPALRHLRMVRSWAGYEGVAADALPLFGALPGVPGAFVNACARGGYHQGPALGEQMAEMILGRKLSLDMRAFDPGRFAA
ncbi:MAG: FAD-binding oxidoreductase [Rhodospirillales bacterium]|nr:FAD-binding oxidoreductase [Rhodospirillales bacterium]